MLAGDIGSAVAACVTPSDTGHGSEVCSETTSGAPIVLIDARVDDAATLLQDAPAHAEILLLPADQDALAQITQLLQTRSNVPSLHIISHGAMGTLELGNQTIDADVLNTNVDLLSSWQQSLADDADILIYGCDVAGGDIGEHFIQTLSQITQADVAASSNRTGSRLLGADWILERQIGLVETPVLLAANARSNYNHTLLITIYAAGDTGQESMALQIDSVTVASWENIGANTQGDSSLGNVFEAYTYDPGESVSADRIRVVFNNDVFVDGQIDRNLQVDRIIVDDREFQTESPSVFSTGTWREGIGITPGNTKSETLHANGYFQFSEDALSHDHFITIHAAGQTGTESMQLLIDGEVVQQWDNAGGESASRHFGTFTYATESKVDANRVRVQFINDTNEPDFDRNLIVDKITIDAVVYETEASDVISTGTWTSTDGVVTGFRSSEWLHADGFFQFDANTRTFDGSGNNLQFDDWGTAGTELLRAADAQYADGISEIVSEGLPSAREISNVLVAQDPSLSGNPEALSVAVHVWGQFIDHDLDLTEPPLEGGDPLLIAVPTGDPFFDPRGTGSAVIASTRSEAAHGTGTSTDNAREHENAITAFMDGSMVYGSSAETAASLREYSGGRMIASDGDLLPLDEDGNFVAGDIRAMENINLTAMHTLFVREHNYWAHQLQAANADLNDEQIFQEARKIVIAEIQSITYNEFLPALLGDDALQEYRGYDASVNPGVTTEFSTAAFRFGHTMLNESVQFLDTFGNRVSPDMQLADVFFTPEVIQEQGVDSSLKFIASAQSQTIDNQIVDSLRNFLFGPPGAGGFDLASLNIARGRDHGLADYNTTREAYGLARVDDFDQITQDVDVQNKLRDLYGSVDNIDLWVGGLAEDAAVDRSIGETFTTIIADQFSRIRDGDRFWYQNYLSSDAARVVSQTTLGDIISRNTANSTIQDDVFRMWGVIEGRVEQAGHNPIDSGVGHVQVELYNGEGDFIARKWTDSQGRYRFNEIAETGGYRVVMQFAGSQAFQDVYFYEGNLLFEGVDFTVDSSDQAFS